MEIEFRLLIQREAPGEKEESSIWHDFDLEKWAKSSLEENNEESLGNGNQIVLELCYRDRELVVLYDNKDESFETIDAAYNFVAEFLMENEGDIIVDKGQVRYFINMFPYLADRFSYLREIIRPEGDQIQYFMFTQLDVETFFAAHDGDNVVKLKGITYGDSIKLLEGLRKVLNGWVENQDKDWSWTFSTEDCEFAHSFSYSEQYNVLEMYTVYTLPVEESDDESPDIEATIEHRGVIFIIDDILGSKLLTLINSALISLERYDTESYW